MSLTALMLQNFLSNIKDRTRPTSTPLNNTAKKNMGPLQVHMSVELRCPKKCFHISQTLSLLTPNPLPTPDSHLPHQPKYHDHMHNVQGFNARSSHIRMCLGFDFGPVLCMWVEFVVGSCLAPRVFLQVFRFSSLHKHINQHSKFQFDQARGPAWKPAKADVASSLILQFI